jgi:hypothetical protein
LQAGLNADSKTAVVEYFAKHGLRALNRFDVAERWELYFDADGGFKSAIAHGAAGKHFIADASKFAAKNDVSLDLVSNDAAMHKPAFGEIATPLLALELLLPCGGYYESPATADLVIEASLKFTNLSGETISVESDRSMPFELIVGSLTGGELLILSGDTLPKSKVFEITPAGAIDANFSVKVNDFRGNLQFSARTLPMKTCGSGKPEVYETPRVRVTIA